jgi:predicted flap endonuclease-1-like 5' DNA nuclease
MAKTNKTSKPDEKRPNVDKIVKKVNKEFEKTSTQIEGLVDDAFKQLDSLQNQIQEPVRKLMKEIDELREREMKRFHDELDRRMDEFQKIQSSVMERLGIAQREAKRGQESVTKSIGQETRQTAKTAKSSGKKVAKAGKKTTAAAKTNARKAASDAGAGARKAGATAKAAAKGNDLSDLTRIKGIGPVTARKLRGAGITSINQVANPTEAEQEKLNQFSSTKGFRNWPDEAKKLIG